MTTIEKIGLGRMQVSCLGRVRLGIGLRLDRCIGVEMV